MLKAAIAAVLAVPAMVQGITVGYTVYVNFFYPLHFLSKWLELASAFPYPRAQLYPVSVRILHIR